MESRREMESNLFEAARTGDQQQLASQNAAILDARTKLGNTALHIALIYGQVEFARELCRMRCELLWNENNRRETPLHRAASSWHLNVLRWLKELITSQAFEGEQQKELLGKKDAEGNTALHRLLMRRRNLLSDEDSDLESSITVVATAMLGVDRELSLSINNARESPLYLAAISGWPKLVSCLLQFPSPPGNGGPCGRSPLHAAVRRGDRGMCWWERGCSLLGTSRPSDVQVEMIDHDRTVQTKSDFL